MSPLLLGVESEQDQNLDRQGCRKFNPASTVNLLLLLVYTFHLFLNEDGFEVVKASKTRATKISSLVTKRFQ